MVRIFFFILFCITVAYWIGYRVGKSLSDLRPVCFLSFGDSDSEANNDIADVYWGYFDRPYCNINNFAFLGMKLNKDDVYFLIERNALLKNARGQKVYVTLNIGRFSQRKNPYYLASLFRHGTQILLEEAHTEYEISDEPKNEEPGT